MRSPKQPFTGTCMNKSEQILADRIWKAIKTLQTFTIETIADQAQLTAQEVQGYIFWLCRCRYIRYLGGNCELIRDTGDHAPIATRDGFYDPNIG